MLWLSFSLLFWPNKSMHFTKARKIMKINFRGENSVLICVSKSFIYCKTENIKLQKFYTSRILYWNII